LRIFQEYLIPVTEIVQTNKFHFISGSLSLNFFSQFDPGMLSLKFDLKMCQNESSDGFFLKEFHESYPNVDPSLGPRCYWGLGSSIPVSSPS